MELACQTDPRRDAVRRTAGRKLTTWNRRRPAHAARLLLGKPPPELCRPSALDEHLALEGGDVITGIRILDADPVVDPTERDDSGRAPDRGGDPSLYTLRLVGVKGIDPTPGEFLLRSAAFGRRLQSVLRLRARDTRRAAAELPGQGQRGFDN
jgi:hypothetical protein